MTGATSIDSERLGRIVEESASEVYIFSAETFCFLLVNGGARENLGYSMEELQALTPWDLKPYFTEQQFKKYVAPLFKRTKERLDFETVHRRKDGSCYDVSVRLQLMQHDGAAIFYAAIQDVTELRRTQRALHDASTRLEAILGNTTMAVFMMDDRQHCVFMNPAAEALTGYTFAETQGRPLHDVVHHTYPNGRPFPIHECAIDRAFPENHQTMGEEVFVHKDGSFYPVGFTASPMKDASGKTFGTIIEARNIAKELEARAAMEAFNATLKQRVDETLREREKLEKQLIQAQKMEAVGQLTGGVAHDFNNLLQVIGGNLQLLQKDLAGDDAKLGRVENALAGVRRGADLAAQLLAFGRQQALDPKAVNIARLVRGMDDMLRRTLGESIEIETMIAGGLWNCLVDSVQVENMILNLAINSRDAMQGHGKLTIEAGNAFLDDAYVAKHADVAAGQYVMIAVTDTGCGIAADKLERVFEPFFTTKGPGEGTGLGLSMVYGFVKQSKGHVQIYSEEGDGTTVRIYLPRTHDKEVVSNQDSSHVPHATTNETILVVEDDDAVRATSVELLSDLGYHVVEANNADNAMAVINSGLKIDLLFTDVVMPGKLRSPELARRAQQKLPSLRVLFTSGYTQNAIVHAGRLDDGVELIAKPFTRERLAQKICSVLAGAANPVPGPEANEKSPAGKEALRILVVEDEAIIRMTLCEILRRAGHDVIETGSIADAKAKLAGQAFELMISDLGLPDGSGIELVQASLIAHPDMAIIIASGRNPRHVSDDAALPETVQWLMKPYDEAVLLNMIAEIQSG